MFSTTEGDPLAIVKDGSDNNELIFVQKEGYKQKKSKVNDQCKYITLNEGQFEQLPSPNIRVLYIAGPSGSGKSTYAAKYIEKYLKLYKDAKLFIFSSLKEDKTIDHLPSHRITISDDLIHNPIDIQTEIKNNSIVLFDDIDQITSKPLMQAINKVRRQILEIGRHKNIHVVVTSHLICPNERSMARTLLNEMQSLTIFPSSGSTYQISYVLKQYYGCSPKQIKHILSMKSRWVTIIKIYPQVILSEKEITFMSNII